MPGVAVSQVPVYRDTYTRYTHNAFGSCTSIVDVWALITRRCIEILHADLQVITVQVSRNKCMIQWRTPLLVRHHIGDMRNFLKYSIFYSYSENTL